MLLAVGWLAGSTRRAGIGYAVEKVLPERFNWPLFVFALLLMSVPVLNELRSKVSDLLLLLAIKRIESR